MSARSNLLRAYYEPKAATTAIQFLTMTVLIPDAAMSDPTMEGIFSLFKDSDPLRAGGKVCEVEDAGELFTQILSICSADGRKMVGRKTHEGYTIRQEYN